MNPTLAHLIDRFAGLEVVVIGDAMLDVYLEGAAGRLCREAPVPIVSLNGRRDAPGGAANTAVNVRSLGARVSFLSVIGGDAEGALLRRSLEGLGVPTAHLLTEPARRTRANHRVVADGQVLVRFDQGSAGPAEASVEDLLLDRLASLLPGCDAVIVSDYGRGILTPRVIGALARHQMISRRPLVVDSKDLAAYRGVGVTAAKPNYDEAVRLLGADRLEQARARVEQITSHGERLLDVTGARVCAVTLDTEGALVFERGHPHYRTYARPTPHSRAAGAGDTFASALALGLAAGADTPTATDLASAAASIVVGRTGTVACSARDLREYGAVGAKYVPDVGRLAAWADHYRQQGRRIVFTDGCFDILHRGHVTCLNRAKALGDVLVVGVNTDASIRRLKGPGRPISTLDDRVQILAALSCVDHIVAFDEDWPEDLVRAVRPDVFAKGGNHTRERLPEAALVEELGGSIKILPYMADSSTSGIIERIRAGDTRVA